MNLDSYKIVILFCLIVIFCNFIFMFTTIDKQSREIDSLGAAYLKARSKTDPDYILQSAARKARNDLDSVITAIPAFHKFPYVVKDISGLVENNNLTSSVLIFNPVKTERLDMWQYNSQFSVTGSYTEIKSFIAQFQQINGINTISRLSFSKVTQKDEQLYQNNKINLDISTALYCRGDGQ
ncbi:MAG: type 4a pilus biogenesis protein PilO [Desulfamplus sp.]